VNAPVTAQNIAGHPQVPKGSKNGSQRRSRAGDTPPQGSATPAPANAASTCGVCGAGVKHDRFLCSRCVNRLADDLRAYTRQRHETSLVDELSVTATRQSRMTAPGDGSRATERPLPFDERAALILSDDVAWLIDACHRFGADDELTTSGDADACALWLWSHVELIAAHASGVVFAHDAARRSTRAVRAIDRPPGTWYAGRCVECASDLYAAEGAATVECRACHTNHDVEVQRERLLIAVEDRLATASEICRAVHLLDRPVTRSMIDHWVERGQLMRRGRSGAGHFMYRIGDVLTLVASSPIGGNRR
jgi:hypothetical protein